MKTNIISVLFVASLFWIGTANANLISNGDFETGNLDGWQKSKDVQIINSGPLSSVPGMDGYYAAFGYKTKKTTNKLWQDFDVSGFNSVKVTFDWAFEFEDNLSGVKDVFISILRDFDGSSVNNITLDRLVSTGNNSHINSKLLYGTYSEVIDISGFNTDNARLQFRLSEHVGPIYSWAGIDNVNVSPVPEPATMLLFGTGLASLIAVRHRKNKK